jgi:hypothetical protein
MNQDQKVKAMQRKLKAQRKRQRKEERRKAKKGQADVALRS